MSVTCCTCPRFQHFLYSVVLLISVCALSTCGQRGQREFVDLQKIPDENERLRVFSSYPVNRQIDIYLFSQMPKSRAVDTYFRFMAHQGDGKVLPIAKRIDSEKEASFKTDLIRVLDLIDEDCACVRNNSEIMELLAKNSVDVVETDPPHVRGFKDLYASTLERIESRTQSP